MTRRVLLAVALIAACASEGDELELDETEQALDFDFADPHDPHNVPMDRNVGAKVCENGALGGACQRIVGVSPDLEGEDWTQTKTPMRSTISSIQLAPGWQATLCTGIGLNGTCRTITNNNAGVAPNAYSNLEAAINNAVRSFDVRPTGYAAAKVIVCYGALARQCAAIRTASLDLAGQTFPNGAAIDNTIQSWVLAPGVKAKLCDRRLLDAAGACTEHEQSANAPPFQMTAGAPIDMDWRISSIDITTIGKAFAKAHACRDRDFRGYCIPFADSHPDVSLLQWPNGASMANSVSSLRVAGGARAHACSGRLSGTCASVASANLADHALDDRLTSIEIVPAGLAASGVIACADRDLRGDCRSLLDHVSLNLTVTPWGERSWDNAISSVAVGPNRTVRLCSGIGLEGPCTTIPSVAGSQAVNLAAGIDNATTSFTVKQDALFACQGPDFTGPCVSFQAGDTRLNMVDLRWYTGAAISWAGGGISSLVVAPNHGVRLCTGSRLGGNCTPFESGNTDARFSLAGTALDDRTASFAFVGTLLGGPSLYLCKHADLTGPCRGYDHTRLELAGTFADGTSLDTAAGIDAVSRVRVCPAIRLGGACREVSNQPAASSRLADWLAGPVRSFEPVSGFTPGHLFVCRSAAGRGPCVAAGEPTSEWGVQPRPAWREIDGYRSTGAFGSVDSITGSVFVTAGFRGVACAADDFAAPCVTVTGEALVNTPANFGASTAEVRRLIASGQPTPWPAFPAGSGPAWSEGTQGVAHDADSWYFASIDLNWPDEEGFPYIHKVALRDVGTDRGRITTTVPSWVANNYNPICRHVGDPAFHGNRLYVPADDCSDGNGARLLVYSPALAYLGQYFLEGLTKAPWVAIDPQTNHIIVPRDNFKTLAVFEPAGAIANGAGRPLSALYDIALEMPAGMTKFSWTQGGEFSPAGKLYIVNENLERTDGGDDFRFFAPPGIYVYQLVGGLADFDHFIPVPDYDPEWDGTDKRFAELEGITLWDLPPLDVDGGRLQGQIHYVLLENCGLPAFCGSDEAFLRHVSLPVNAW